jgi:beta-lactamase class D
MPFPIYLWCIGILACILLPTSAYVREAQLPLREEPDLAVLFSQAGLEGCFVLLDPARGEIVTSNETMAREQLLPASTFKVAHALIALDLGVHAGPCSFISWDGIDRGYAPWNRDLTLEEAFRYSAVWFFQETARRIGAKRMAEKVRALDYGNADTSGPSDAFWLEGGLRISALEQVEFLRRLYAEALPISRTAMRQVKEMLVLEETPSYRLYAKTGWAVRVSPQVGWLIGYVERDGRVFFFATNIRSEAPDEAFPKARMNLSKACLERAGVIETR